MIIKLNYNTGGSSFIIFEGNLDDFKPEGWFDAATITREDGKMTDSRDLRRPKKGPTLILTKGKKIRIAEISIKNCEFIEDDEAFEMIRRQMAMTAFIEQPDKSREQHHTDLIERFPIEEEEEEEDIPDLPSDLIIVELMEDIDENTNDSASSIDTLSNDSDASSS